MKTIEHDKLGDVKRRSCFAFAQGLSRDREVCPGFDQLFQVKGNEGNDRLLKLEDSCLPFRASAKA